MDSSLPQPIEAVLQTRDGYLWVGTQAGLARFDGIHFTLFRVANNPGLRDNSIVALFEDRSGDLWVGTAGGVSRYANGKFEAVGPENISGISIAQDSAGAIWIGTAHGLWRYAGGSMRVVDDQPAVRNVGIVKVAGDREGRLWVAPNRAPVLVMENGKFREFERAGFRIENVHDLSETREGDLWFATETQGLYRLHADKWAHYGPEQGLGSSDAHVVMVDAQDRVWAVASGLYLLGRGGPDRFGFVAFRSLENYRSIAEDREGNVWLGTNVNGLIRVAAAPLRSYSDQTGEVSPSIRGVTEDSSGAIWAAAAQAPPEVLSGGVLRECDPSLGLRGDSYSIHAMADGTVWNGADSGLQILGNGTVRNFPQYRTVRALFQDRTGAVWLAPEGAPVVRYQSGKFETLGGRKGMPAGSGGSFAEGPDGAVYIGFLNDGLATAKDGSIKLENTKTGLPGNHVRAVCLDGEGNLWLGIKGRGLVVRSGGQWYNPQAFSDLFQDQVSALIEDRGRLFIGALNGLFYAPLPEVLAMARGGPAAHFHHVALGDDTATDALYSSTQPVVCRARDGTLWFATRRGLVGIDPDQLGTDPVPPPVYIERTLLDERTAEPGAELRVPPGARNLKIEYTGLGLSRPLEVLFKYRLDGYDADWVDARSQREAYYANLKPGRYLFHVTACNADGVWNETGASLAIVKEPWFYETTAFRALFLGLVLGTGFGLYRWRLRHAHRRAAALRRQNQELERRIAERTAELEKSYGMLRVSENFYHSLVESLPQILVRKDVQGRAIYANHAYAELVGRPLADIVGRTDADVYPADRAAQFREDDRMVMETGQTIEREATTEDLSGRRRYLHVKKTALYDEQKRCAGVLVQFWDTTVFRETEEKLKAAQSELLETSRLAGMAEVATGMLHDFGNALTTVNISSTLAIERLEKLKLPSLSKVAALLMEHREQLPSFFATDPRAGQLPEYLATLAKHLEEERNVAVHELTLLLRSVEHINGIVAEQQNQAKAVGSTEIVAPTELFEYAFSITEASLRRDAISVDRDYAQVPAVSVPRQRALQILINLIRNSRDSLNEHGAPDKRITLALRLSPQGFVQMRIGDNGMGIDPEKLARLFDFGFTTKKSGHGFGLHSSVLAAKEMGGSLRAESPGLGLGATFVLELPPAQSGVAAGPQPA